MKTYHLIAHDGAVRPGKATTDQIAEALDRTESYQDRIATLTLVDGELVASPLTDKEIAEVRTQLAALRKNELVALLDHLFAAAKAANGLQGITNPSITILIEQAPYAEDIVRDWGTEHGLFVKDSPMPTSGRTWIRTCSVDLTERSWSPSVVTLQWPSQKCDAATMVARDADLDGRTTDAETIRADAEDLAF